MSKEERIKKAQQRLQKNYESRNTSAFALRPQVLDLEKIGGYKKELFYKPKADTTNRIDILPYTIKTDKHPQKMSIGETDYILDVWVHRYCGPKEGDYICLEKTYGLPCPICEDRVIRSKDPEEDKDELKKLLPKRRGFYNIIDLDSNAREPQVQLFEESHFLFEKELLEEAGIGEGVTIFYDPEIGKSIEFRTRERSSKNGKFTEYKRFDFIDRKPYKENIVKFTYSLDDLLIVPSYEEIRNDYYGASGGESFSSGDREGRPSISSSSTTIPDDNSTDNPFADRGEPEEEPTSKRTRTRERHKESSQEDNNPCPSGHRFGHDFESKAECRSGCPDDTWNKCGDELDKIEEHA